MTQDSGHHINMKATWTVAGEVLPQIIITNGTTLLCIVRTVQGPRLHFPY